MHVPLTIGDFLERAALVYGETGWRSSTSPTWRARSAPSPTPRCTTGRSGHGPWPSTPWASAPGERVAIVSPNSARFLISYFGVSGFGRVLVPINFRLNAEEVAYIVEHSGASVLLVDPELDEPLAGVSAKMRLVLDGVRRRRAVRAGPGRRPTGAVAGRRGGHLLDQLHLGHHGAAQGRAAHPPQLLAERRHLRMAHHCQRPRPVAAHPAHVPLQRLGHALCGHGHGRPPRRAAQDRRRGDPPPHRGRGRHPAVRGAGGGGRHPRRRRRARRGGASRSPDAGRSGWSWPARPRRRRPSRRSRPSSAGSSSRSTG